MSLPAVVSILGKMMQLLQVVRPGASSYRSM